ncbi:acyl-CoA carboxylase epsilon subunit [Streptomyces avidinii]|uniref:acyl-CoA carboxylase epsilon subunit n=1 Tax=Streptomyces avidinii TaxID=1895 RepID=UPI0037BC6263
MTAREAAGPDTPQPQTWRIHRGHPDEDETAAVLAVLTALLAGRAAPPEPAPPPTAPAAWDRPHPARPRRAGSWRPH